MEAFVDDATGGPFDAGQWPVVGERGPEVSFDIGGMVQPVEPDEDDEQKGA